MNRRNLDRGKGAIAPNACMSGNQRPRASSKTTYRPNIRMHFIWHVGLTLIHDGWKVLEITQQLAWCIFAHVTIIDVRITIFVYKGQASLVAMVMNIMHVLWKPQIATGGTTRANMRKLLDNVQTTLVATMKKIMPVLWKPQTTTWGTTRGQQAQSRWMFGFAREALWAYNKLLMYWNTLHRALLWCNILHAGSKRHW